MNVHGPALGVQLAAERRHTFVGRAEQLAAFEAMLASNDSGPCVLYLHGPGGLGKTTLLHMIAEQARTAGCHVLRFDGRALAVSPASLTDAVGNQPPGERLVLMLDTFEQCQGLERWLYETVLPTLPSGTITVVAGRRPPSPAWRVDGAWSTALRVMRLTDLPRTDAEELLVRRRLPAKTRDDILAFAGGNPLALALAASVASGANALPQRWQPGADIVHSLLDQLIGDMPSDEHRRALEVCAHARTTTEELLRVVLPADAGRLFRWLRELPFVEPAPQGLFPHDIVRHLLDTDLRWRDPGTYRALNQSLRSHLLGQVRTAPAHSVMDRTLEYSYLQHRSGEDVSEYLGWDDPGGIFEDTLRHTDRAALLDLTASQAGRHSAQIAEFWMDNQPQGFRVYRNPHDNSPRAYICWLQLTAPEAGHLTADPVVAAAWQHTSSIPAGRHLGMMRFIIAGPEAYSPRSPVMGLISVRHTAELLHASGMTHSFLAFEDTEYWGPVAAYTQHHPAGTAQVGDRTHTLWAHDWTKMPLDRWLDKLDRQALPEDKPASEQLEPGMPLSRAEFDQAVREAVKYFQEPAKLAVNPLLRNAVRTRPGVTALDALREAVEEGVDALLAEPSTAGYHRVVAAAYFQGPTTQPEAAARLGMAFSTYRRHLNHALSRISDHLYDTLG
ncbi:ATP-binding protein [Streptomyces rishiriensis]|uniref:Uncharacterized protein n=1 Tax=Streptomyces rishiriensis TaxID=68264 RepID=A0ABU0NG45_STRRH|nr:ATP-binding protein [Streptomyces rishiriensis]MDQ0578075.1 hypothetical protein [Streptomyces rishiriensis]